jgi:hypothetical protein
MTRIRRFIVPSFVLFLTVALSAGAYAQQARPDLPNAASPAVTAGDQTYRIFADVVTSGIGKPGVQGVNCVAQSVFYPGDTIVFRAVIADGTTGTVLGTADIARLGLQAVVNVSDGTKVPLHFTSHPPPVNAPVHRTYWAASMRTGADHPTGTLKWTLVVTDKNGHTVTFSPLGQDNGAAVLELVQRAPAGSQ